MLGSDSPVSNVGPNALGYAETFELMLRVLAGAGVDAASLAAVSPTAAGRVYGLPA